MCRVKQNPVNSKADAVEELEDGEMFNTFNAESVPVVGSDDKQSFPYRAPLLPTQIRQDIPAEISDLIISSLRPAKAARPRISAILGALDQYAAMLERQKGIESAQKQMVLTKTVGINVHAFRKKKPKAGGLKSLFKKD